MRNVYPASDDERIEAWRFYAEMYGRAYYWRTDMWRSESDAIATTALN